MKRFARLYQELDATTKTSIKLGALTRYFAEAPSGDAAWALRFLLGRRGRRGVQARHMRAWIASLSGQPSWMVEECYDVVGDLAETVSLLLPETQGLRLDVSLEELAKERVVALLDMPPQEQRELVEQTWLGLSRSEALVYGKLITGAFRVGVSAGLIERALAEVAGVDQATIAHRLMGGWQPSGAWYESVLSADASDADVSRPYPFLLANPLESEPSGLGDVSDFLAEWKWDGIRAQIVRRSGQTFLWSRGGELINDAFPELAQAAMLLPNGTAIDGEVLAWRGGSPMGFDMLQQRLQRKAATRQVQARVPVRCLAYDLLEIGAVDVRSRPLAERRALLERLLEHHASAHIGLAPVLEAATWPDLALLREQSRDRGVEGLMLKRQESLYEAGRPRGAWWKWKVDPFTIDAVLTAAQQGRGRRAALYTDYTFSLWDGDQLVTIAKAYSGLDDSEIREVDRFVRSHITGRFGPVRSVEPALVFELAFEGVQRSGRHASGVALRFPRMARWRRDKSPAEADHVERLRALLPQTFDEQGRLF